MRKQAISFITVTTSTISGLLPFPALLSRLLLDQIHNLSGPTSESNLFLICSLQDTHKHRGGEEKNRREVSAVKILRASIF